MKIVEKIEVEYVIPENESERKEIENIIKSINEEEKSDFTNFDNLKIIKKKEILLMVTRKRLIFKIRISLALHSRVVASPKEDMGKCS